MSEAEWLGEQPLGERPELASAFRQLDDGISQLEAENLLLRAKLEKSEDRGGELMAEINNMYPRLSKLGKELAGLTLEFEHVAKAWHEALDELDELRPRVHELEAALAEAVVERDTARVVA